MSDELKHEPRADRADHGADAVAERRDVHHGPDGLPEHACDVEATADDQAENTQDAGEDREARVEAHWGDDESHDEEN